MLSNDKIAQLCEILRFNWERIAGAPKHPWLEFPVTWSEEKEWDRLGSFRSFKPRTKWERSCGRSSRIPTINRHQTKSWNRHRSSIVYGHTRIRVKNWTERGIDLFGDKASVLNFIVSNSYYGMLRRQTDQFRYIKIQLNTIELSVRCWGINPTNSVITPRASYWV